MSTISSLVWIPRGSARQKPVRFELTAEDVNKLRRQQLQDEGKEVDEEEEEVEEEEEDDENMADSDEDGEVAPAASAVDGDDTELPPEFDMDNYDNENNVDLLETLDNDDLDDDEDEDGMNMGELELFPHGDAALAMEMREDDEDDEDDEIKPSDTLIAVALTEEDCSHVEIQVLTAEGVLYTHHDILLPDFPLSLAWLDCPPFLSEDNSQTAVGNYLAVGTFSPGIELWNLDVLDPIEPSATLGGYVNPQHRNPKLKPQSHSEAVLSLSWNATYRSALASGSADKSVKVWDVTTQQCQLTLSDAHSDKVQSVLWHPSQAWLLASAAFDRAICLTDCRTAASGVAARLSSDVESMVFDPFHEHLLYVATENGTVSCVDLRQFSPSQRAHGGVVDSQSGLLFSFQAHDTTVSSLSFSQGVPGMLATASLDKTVKVWDTSSVGQASSASAIPSCVAYKSLNVGQLFALRFSPDDAFLLAAGGNEGTVAVWESDELETLRAHFSSRAQPIHSLYLQNHTTNGEGHSALSSNSSTGNLQHRHAGLLGDLQVPTMSQAALQRSEQQRLVDELAADFDSSNKKNNHNNSSSKKDKKKDKKKR